MKQTHQLLEAFFHTWRRLKIWGGRLSNLALRFEDAESARGPFGITRDVLRRAVLLVPADDIPGGLKILLHEMAHAAGNGLYKEDQHGRFWRITYQSAVEEATGRYTYVGLFDEEGWTADDVDAALELTIREWWEVTGKFATIVQSKATVN